MSEFSLKTKLYMGDSLGEVMKDFRRVFIVTDGFMSSSNKVNYVVERLAENAEYEVFDAVSSNPDVETVTVGTEQMAEYQPDAVVAFGGGSPIDGAKAMVYFAAQAGKLKNYRLIAVPTTSGTGSEVSKYSVITDTKKQMKYPLADDSLIPDVAVLDAELVKTALPIITAYTGMDVFTHAVESYVSTDANDFTRALGEKAVRLVEKSLLKAYKEPGNMDARQEMHNASCLAGAAFSNAGLGMVHAMAHALGGRFSIPHGKANAILLPYVMGFNAGCTDGLNPSATRYAEIARSMGLGSSSIRQSALNLIRWAKRTTEKMQLPSTIADAKVNREDFEAVLPFLAEAALADRCMSTNPRSCTSKDVMEVFRKAYYGKVAI